MRLTPRSCMVTPYSTSASSMVPPVGDDDELGFSGDAPHIAGVAHHVGLVQGGLDLVHHAEGRGVDLENGKVQGDGHEGLFAAGQQGDGFQLLARGLHLDLDAAVEDVSFVLQLQPGLAAAEQL